jgi:potassium-transporting ATPase potassium-binding subunit
VERYGLMVGRTPEYLGKKIESYDVKMATLAILVTSLTILILSAIASIGKFGTASISNPGPHGLSQILYAYTSAVGNNGSAFSGLNANTLWFNSSLGVAMLLGRFFMIIPILAIAGNLAAKKHVPESLWDVSGDGPAIHGVADQRGPGGGGADIFPCAEGCFRRSELPVWTG